MGTRPLNNDFEHDAGKAGTCPNHLLLNSFPIKSTSIIPLTTPPRASSNAAVPCAPSLSILGTFSHAQVLAAFTNRPAGQRVGRDQARRQAVHRPARTRAGREGLHPGIPEERRARAAPRRRARGRARPCRRPCPPRTSVRRSILCIFFCSGVTHGVFQSCAITAQSAESAELGTAPVWWQQQPRGGTDFWTQFGGFCLKWNSPLAHLDCVLS